MSDYFVGIDLGGTNSAICLISAEGDIVGRASQPTRVELGPTSFVERVSAAGKKLIEDHHLQPDQVKALGIGSPGPLSISQGKIIKAGNLPGFDDFPLRGEFSKKLQLPAVLDNDANIACWGEYWLGAGRGATDITLFTLGTGIGGGIVSCGELLHGSQDNGAELGHMIIHPGGRLCTCGQLGCLEAYASASHTADRARQALEKNPSSSMRQVLEQNGELTCKDVFEHARNGDKLADEIVDGTARALAHACVNMRHITEPQRVILAGGMTNAGDFLTDRVRRFYEDMMWTLRKEPMEICLAQLGEDAGVIGAAGLARHDYQKKSLYPIGA